MMLVTVRRLTFRWVATCCFVLHLRVWPAESSASRGRLSTRNRSTARSQWFNSNRTRCPVLEKGRIPRCIQWPIVRALTWRCCATCALVRHCFSVPTASTAVFSGMRICLATIRAALRCRCHYGPLPPGEVMPRHAGPLWHAFQAGIAIKGEFQPEVVAARGQLRSYIGSRSGPNLKDTSAASPSRSRWRWFAPSTRRISSSVRKRSCKPSSTKGAARRGRPSSHENKVEKDTKTKRTLTRKQS